MDIHNIEMRSRIRNYDHTRLGSGVVAVYMGLFLSLNVGFLGLMVYTDHKSSISNDQANR